MNQLRVLALAACVAGCQYDFDKLYEHAADGGLVQTPDAAPMLSSTALISSWINNQPEVDAECVACAESKCQQENSDCESDPACVQYTECVARKPTPEGQLACREQFSSWVNAGNVRDRDLAGPYGQCVFRYKCSKECTDDAELWCAGKYTLPFTSSSTVPLHLYLIDALDQKKPLVGATVKVCSAQSLLCNAPDATATTNEQGKVDLALPSSFSRAFTGYLEISGAGRYPTLLKFSWSIAQETTQLVSVVAEASFKQAIESLLSLKIDDQRGMLQLRMLGCQGAGVKGVHFDIVPPAGVPPDPAVKAWYIDNGIPKIGATETTPVGSGGLINVVEGNVTVAAAKADNTVVASVAAPVRAKYMTVVVFAPKDAR
jgi:hypothetical protein